MKKLIKFSLDHPLSIIIYFFLTIIFGIISVFLLNVNYLPRQSERFLLISTDYPGINAEEIQRLITIPLEDCAASLKGVKNIESTSRQGVSLIKAELNYYCNLDNSIIECTSLIDSMMDKLPNDCPRPKVEKFLSSEQASVKIVVCPLFDTTMSQLSRFAEEDLKTKFFQMKEVGGVCVSGKESEEIQIILKSDKMNYYGLSLEKVAEAINLSNYEYPAGSIKNGDDRILLKTDSLYHSYEDILRTPLLTEKKGSLILGDIAVVKKEVSEARNFEYYNGERSVLVSVSCKNNANPLKLSHKIRILVRHLENDYRDKYKFIIIQDTSDVIFQTIKNLITSTLLGVAITSILLRYFFASKKISALISASILFSVFFSLFILYLFKRSLNIISLSGITICIGMIVDNSIVSIKSIEESLKNNTASFKLSIKSGLESVILSNSASTLTSIIVFLPLFFIRGLLGDLFKDLAITITAGMSFSLLYSFTVIPAVLSFFPPDKFNMPAKSIGIVSRAKALNKNYGRLLSVCFKKRNLAAKVLSLSVLFSVLIFFFLKKEIQPKTKTASFTSLVNLKANTSSAALMREGKTISENLPELKDVRAVSVSSYFDSENYSSLMNPLLLPETLLVTVYSKRIVSAKNAFESYCKERNLSYKILPYEDLLTQKLLLKNDFLLLRDDFLKAREDADSLFTGNYSPNYILAQNIFTPDKKLLQKYRLSPYQITSAIKNNCEGLKCLPYYEKGRQIPLLVKTDSDDCIIIPGKAPVRLEALGTFSSQTAEGILYRYNKKDAKIIRAEDVRKNGELFSLKGAAVKEMFLSASGTLLLILILLYCLLGAETESLKMPLVFFMSLPPALFGAEFFLLIFGQSLNINSLMGLVVLSGTCVNNSIIIADCASKAQTKKTLYQGAVSKVEVIVITNLTTVASLLPFSFNFSGTNAQSSLSVGIIGGLFVSTLLTVFIVPCFFYRRIK